MADDISGAETWQVNRNLTLKSGNGHLVATFFDRPSMPLAYEMVPLLEPFSTPKTVEEGAAQFLVRFGDDVPADLTAQLDDVIRQMQEAGVLVPAGSDAALSTGWYSSPETHVLMLSDQNRTLSYRTVLQRHAPGKTLLEIGCGSGTLACFAALAGARRVYAIEQSTMIDTAREIAERNGVADRITFIAGNSVNVELPEEVDVVYSELLGTDPLEEAMIASLTDARRFLKSGGLMIPADVSLWVVGVESNDVERIRYLFEQKGRAAEALSDAYGLDLGPLVERYKAGLMRRQYARREPRHSDLIAQEPIAPPNQVLTAEACLLSVDLANIKVAFPITNTVDLKVTESGMHNAINLYFKSKLDDFCTLNTGPYSPQPLKNWRSVLSPLPARSVRAGETIPITATIAPEQVPTVTFARPG